MTLLLKQSQIADASTADLIETYNALTGKGITRFSSRSAGESQVANAILLGQDRAAHAGVPKGTKTIAPIPLAKPKPKKQVEETTKPNGITHIADAITKPKPDATSGAKHLAAFQKKGACPLCGADHDLQKPAGKEGSVAGDERALCSGCGNEYWSKGEKAGALFARRKPGRDVSKAIRETWADADVRAARSLKQRVIVDGTGYRSVFEAFKALGLPESKHVKFRMELKAAGKAVFAGHKFSIVAAA